MENLLERMMKVLMVLSSMVLSSMCFAQSEFLILMDDNVSESQSLANTYSSRVTADGGTIINSASVLSVFETMVDNSLTDSILVWVEADLAVKKVSGDTVSTWYDIKGHDLLQDSNDSMAVLGANQINTTYPALRFALTVDAADDKYDSYQFDKPITSPTRLSAFIVIKKFSDPSDAGGNGGLWDFSGNDANATHWNYTDGNIYDDFGSTTRQTVGNPTPALTSWHLYEVRSASGEWTAWLDGEVLHTTEINTVGLEDYCTLGKSRGNTFLVGWIAAFIVTTTFNHTTLRTYLATKYGITLP